ncbi:hypothetical protein C6P45_002237 [Maudiozyma exigua]|uniref:Uncharacterized protein n=1 Tax=Maudiozyma exigua TaxID=34358 RepID=A0A9P7B4J8_MAUEX|nr:hypothetical protein C6P45_002237 [Kazachstania exigua]
MKIKRLPKRGKKKTESKRDLVTQEDYYEEGTFAEEQAERWLLSDIRKTLRFYLEAYEYYQIGLNTTIEQTEKGSYDISYNETRLMLQIYNDYLFNSGYINILQYVKLDDIPNLNQILKTLPEIVLSLETVYNTYSNNSQIDQWDLQYNLLTSYMSLLESNEYYNIKSANVIEISNKFVQLSQVLIKRQIKELENFEQFITDINDQNNDEDNLIRDTLDESTANINDGSGIITNPENNKNKEEKMEVSDQITKETLSEVFLNCYKFIETILEIIIQSKMVSESETDIDRLNEVQINYLVELVDKLYAQLNDIEMTELGGFTLDMKDIDVAKFSIDGDKKILQGDLDEFLKYENLEVGDSDYEIDIAFDMVKIDGLELSIECFTNQDSMIEWELSSLLSKKINVLIKKISTERNNILTISKFNQEKMEKLSSVVFTLCNIYVTSSDNELRRYAIKTSNQGHENATKIANILFKNSKVLLTNAQKISQQACGMQETIVDKLKRNYIYNQATTRLQLLEAYENQMINSISTSQIDPNSLDAAIQDLLKDHPFYSKLS